MNNSSIYAKDDARQPLTKNELDFARIIQEFWEVYGHSPSYCELMVEMDLYSRGGICRYVAALKRKGWLVDYGKQQPRALRLTAPVPPAPINEPGALLLALACDALRAQFSFEQTKYGGSREETRRIVKSLVEFCCAALVADNASADEVKRLIARLPIAMADAEGVGPGHRPRGAMPDQQGHLSS